MYTEYVFDDKKYEVASKNLKSILFDIVNAETSKLADIREKIAEADESDLRNKMIELCNRQESTILSILEVSNVLNSTLQTIDSFSRDLRNVENESLTEIVSHYVKQQTSLAAEQQNVNEVEQQPSLATEQQNVNEVEQQPPLATEQQNVNEVEQQEVNAADPITDAVEAQNVQPDNVEIEDTDANQVEQQEEVASETDDAVENAISEENPSLAEQISDDVKPEGVESEENSKEDIVDSEQDAVASEESDDAPVIESSTPVIPGGEIESEKQPEEAVPDIFGVVDASESEVADGPIVDAVSEDVSEGQEESVDEQPVISTDETVVSDGAVSSEVDDTSIVSDETDNQDGLIVDEQPVVDIVNSLDVESVIGNVDDSNDNENEDVVADIQVDVGDDKISDDELPQNNIISLPPIEGASDINDGEMVDESEVLHFIKLDNNSPRAILTTVSQVSKLRASREINESLLTAKQFFKFSEKSADNTLDEQLINKDIIEQQSINDIADNNNDILLSDANTSEERMEEMMNKITELYNSGKVDEAQALSEKVSELNKELQQNQKVLAA